MELMFAHTSVSPFFHSIFPPSFIQMIDSLLLLLFFFCSVSIFPPSNLTMEAEATPAESTPLCLTKHSASDTYAELPSSTVLGRPQSPPTSIPEKSEVRRRTQGGSIYIRSKIKVSQWAGWSGNHGDRHYGDSCMTVSPCVFHFLITLSDFI